MSRPVQYNNTIKFEGIPEGYMGEGFMATNFEKVVSLARNNWERAKVFWHEITNIAVCLLPLQYHLVDTMVERYLVDWILQFVEVWECIIRFDACSKLVRPFVCCLLV